MRASKTSALPAALMAAGAVAPAAAVPLTLDFTGAEPGKGSIEMLIFAKTAPRHSPASQMASPSRSCPWGKRRPA